MKNKTLTQSISNQHCPSCRSEKMFVSPVYSRRFNVMHKRCPNCAQTLEPEPGFYTGAMYVSYAIQVAIVISVVVASKFLGIDGGVGWYLGWITGLVIALFPITYRLSRSIWAHLLIPFRGNALVEKTEQ